MTTHLGDTALGAAAGVDHLDLERPAVAGLTTSRSGPGWGHRGRDAARHRLGGGERRKGERSDCVAHGGRDDIDDCFR